MAVSINFDGLLLSRPGYGRGIREVVGILAEGEIDACGDPLAACLTSHRARVAM